MAKIQEQVVRRFEELANQAQQIPLINQGDITIHASHQQFYAWATSALNAIQGVFGKDSPHYTRFEAELSRISNNNVCQELLDSFRGIFLGAKSDV